uniref:Secreted protein n=1 Tax=Desmodus rotundus TaxID=9430 RepID=K9IGQ4_DESRO
MRTLVLSFSFTTVPPVLASRMTATLCHILGIYYIYHQLRSEIKPLFIFVVDSVVIIFNCCFTSGKPFTLCRYKKNGMDGKYVHSLHLCPQHPQNYEQFKNSDTEKKFTSHFVSS